MKSQILAEKYPISVLELPKSETTCRSVDDVIAALRARVAADPGAAEIGVFDHYAHTTKLGGEIAPGMVAAKNLVFCFGPALPKAEMLALRPRSYGVAEFADRFVVSFMDAPLPPAQKKMTEWADALKRA
jgi:hypothetical protein